MQKLSGYSIRLSDSMINLLTIDVEDWFHTTALEPYIDPKHWDSLKSRIETNVKSLLDLLEIREVRATFFILGWVAERYPGIVKEIAECGHEIASHGYRHRLIYHLTPEIFQDYVRRSKHVLEDLTGKPVLGYRAASFSIVKSTLWALDVINEAGFVYDSSIFPVRHDLYGMADSPRFPFVHDNGLIEIPPSTVRFLKMNIPFGGGGYFRLYPYWLTRMSVEMINRAGYPAVVYLHPWELDPDCPRIPNADWRTRFRQYINLDKTKGRVQKLLAEFQFMPINQYLENTRSWPNEAHNLREN
jgi:polysaccharide deacetylase family protein (PEP-CTERM system associated)